MGGPAEPHEPRREGAGRPPEDDDDYGYNDEAYDDVSAYARRGRASDGPGYSPDAGYSPSAGYASDGDAGDEYEAPVITEDELAGLGPEGGSGPRRVLPLEDEPTTLVARYL